MLNLTLNNPHDASSNPHNETLRRKYGIEKCHMKHLPLDIFFHYAKKYKAFAHMYMKGSVFIYFSSNGGLPRVSAGKSVLWNGTGKVSGSFV